MIEWGLSFGSHDSAIAVFQDDALVFATEGERWSRKKHDKELPQNLIDYVLQTYGDPQEIYYFEDWEKKNHRRKVAGQEPKLKPRMIAGKHYNDWNITGHHHSHASWGYYSSPFVGEGTCTTIVIDAIGEWDTLSIWRCSGGTMSRTFSWNYPKSLGLMYTSATIAAGFKGNSEEYKMMGAAAYGHGQKEYEVLKALLDHDFNFHKGWDYQGDRFEIAAGAQRLYRERLELLTKYVEGPVVLVGGCALNTSANRFITNDLYIPPAPNDAGSAIGCVLAHKKKQLDITPFLGYNISNELKLERLYHELATTGYVGSCFGRAELGHRALGHRSILADPHTKNWKLRLNEIKNRESWRPYGMMVREIDMKHYLKNPRPSPYMDQCFEVYEDMVPLDLIHHDGTVRVQTIKNDHALWPLFDHFPILVNTSMNLAGDPLVNDEKDLEAFRQATDLEIP